jgi:hypothetical protein
MRIVVVPLDSRPCNHAWVDKYAAMANVEVSIFDARYAGTMHRGLDHKRLLPWAEDVTKGADVLLVSADAVTSGGLIQARKAAMDVNTAVQRLTALFDIARKNDVQKIYVMDTIMRTSITTKDLASQQLWKDINDYSHAAGMVYFTGDPNWQATVDRLKEQIPAKALDTYLNARQKKHFINQFLCRLTSFGVIDQLMLLQEDTKSGGIQAIENDVLRRLVDDLNITDKATIYNGADEGTLALFAKAILDTHDTSPTIHIQFPNEALRQKVMPFEDRPVDENIQGLLDVIGMRRVEEQDAEILLGVYTEHEPYDLDLSATNPIEPEQNTDYETFVATMNRWTRTDKIVGFVDLLHPNGGNETILRDIDILRCSAYSAWNTATNSLGSMLALLVVLWHNPKADPKSFLLERIIDDCLYQTHVRQIVNDAYLRNDINIHQLGDRTAKTEHWIHRELAERAVRYTDRAFTITLPWNRTFEIDIDMEGSS